MTPIPVEAGLDDLLETIAWAEKRLVDYCNRANAGEVQGGGREFARQVDAQFRTIHDDLRRIRSALVASPVAQCCMCGKKGLSTVEGDGGTECELVDGRWVCSQDCYDRAVALVASPVEGVAALPEEMIAKLSRKMAHEIGHGMTEKTDQYARIAAEFFAAALASPAPVTETAKSEHVGADVEAVAWRWRWLNETTGRPYDGMWYFTDDALVAKHRRNRPRDAQIEPLYASPATSVSDREKTIEEAAEKEFTDYFVRNYPGPDTIIGRPLWHAPKIFRAAWYAIKAARAQGEAG